MQVYKLIMYGRMISKNALKHHNLFWVFLYFGYLLEFGIIFRFLYDVITNKMHFISIGAALFVIFGWGTLNGILYVYYYLNNMDSISDWKIDIKHNINEETHKYHWFIIPCNLLTGVFLLGYYVESMINNNTLVYFEYVSILNVIIGFILSVLYQCIIEYYWHRILHFPFFYKNFHKMHHYYKSPKPFDDVMIHPMEATVYYYWSWGVISWIPMHYYSFMLYMAWIGLTGVLDHCGIIFEIPYIYSSKDHYYHHKLFKVNYGFPHSFMDLIHGTHYSK